MSHVRFGGGVFLRVVYSYFSGGRMAFMLPRSRAYRMEELAGPSVLMRTQSPAASSTSRATASQSYLFLDGGVAIRGSLMVARFQSETVVLVYHRESEWCTPRADNGLPQGSARGGVFQPIDFISPDGNASGSSDRPNCRFASSTR